MLARWSHEARSRFVREVGSVVLGVLIALAIGEIAEAIRWRVRAHNNLSAIRTELATTRAIMREWRLLRPCMSRRWEELDALMRTVRKTGELPDIGRIGGGPSRPATDAEWQAALSAGTTVYMSSEELSRLRWVYFEAARWGDRTEEQQRLAQVLTLMEHAPGLIDSDLQVELMRSIKELKYGTMLSGVIADQVDDALGKDGIGLDEASGAMITPESVAGSPICKPLVVDGRPFKVEAAR